MTQDLLRRAVLATCVAAGTLLAASAQAQTTAAQPASFAAADSIRVERVAAVGRIWGLVRYFHPAGERARAVWDSATAATLSKLTSGMTDAEFAARVDTMLSSLRDPATRVVVRRPAPGTNTQGPGVLYHFA